MYICDISKKQDRIAVIISPDLMRKVSKGFSSFVGKNLEFWQLDLYRNPEDIYSRLSEWNPSGIISEFHPYISEILFSLNKPTVFIQSQLLIEGTCQVNADDLLNAKIAVQHFQENGYKHFAYYGIFDPLAENLKYSFKEFAPSSSVFIFEDKIKTFRRGIEYWKRPNKKFAEWIQSLPKPIGIFAAHDPLARNLMETCHDLNIKVPEEIAILSANNDPIVCEMTYPQISAIEIDWKEVGKKAAEVVIDWIQNKKIPAVQDYPIPPKALIKRSSTQLSDGQDLRVRQAIDYIRENFQKGIHVNDILQQVPIHRRTLERKFKELLGRSPKEEILRHQKNFALDLLKTTQTDIASISELAGFSSPGQMATHLKSEFHRTATQIRKES